MCHSLTFDHILAVSSSRDVFGAHLFGARDIEGLEELLQTKPPILHRRSHLVLHRPQKAVGALDLIQEERAKCGLYAAQLISFLSFDHTVYCLLQNGHLTVLGRTFEFNEHQRAAKTVHAVGRWLLASAPFCVDCAVLGCLTHSQSWTVDAI